MQVTSVTRNTISIQLGCEDLKKIILDDTIERIINNDQEEHEIQVFISSGCFAEDTVNWLKKEMPKLELLTTKAH